MPSTRSKPRADEAPNPSFEHMQAVTFACDTSLPLELMLIGCGGTGSWLALTLARIAKRQKARLTFVDPDVVEEVNCERQNFSYAEVGRNKAETLARRLSGAWGLDITVHARPFAASLVKSERKRLLYIGCVDNAAARRDIATSLEREGNRWGYSQQQMQYAWLDCGNTTVSARGGNFGQIVLGTSGMVEAIHGAFSVPNWCTALPNTMLLQTNLALDEPAVQPAASCEQMALQNAQGLTINAIIAALAGQYVLDYALGTLRRFASYIDTTTMSMSSLPITPLAVATALGGGDDLVKALKRPVKR